MKRFDILTAFPASFSYLDHSIIGRAVKKERVKIFVHDLRNYSRSKLRKIDDRPFGGIAGMVLSIEPIHDCLLDLGVLPKKDDKVVIILTQAGGKIWSQTLVREFKDTFDRYVIICGHYQGVDARVAEHLVDYELSIGNYVLSGGEIAAMVIVDSITRCLQGVVGNEDSLKKESYDENGIIKSAPLYTRPRSFQLYNGKVVNVPEVLCSGDHKKIREWIERNTIKS